MQKEARAPSLPRSPMDLVSWLVVGAFAGFAILVEGKAGYEAQMFLVLVGIILLIGAIAIPRAAAKDGSIGVRFLILALIGHIVGSLLRYYIIQTVYHGVADANGYFGAGSAFAPQFRTLQWPPLPYPYFGTPFVNWTTGILFAFTGPTMVGGFLVHASLAFVGGWYFYKAFRISFPEGNHKLYAFLLFLTPSMWYWPSSLGKDSLVMLFLGIGTYGLALILRSVFMRGFVLSLVGLTGAFMVRPPIAAALAVVGAGAYLLRPTRLRSPQGTAMMWLVVAPLLTLVAFFAVRHTESYLGNTSPIAALQSQQATSFQGGEGSNFNPPSPLSPLGLPEAIITSSFRPFPWEAGGFLPALASLEGLFVIGVLLVKRREVWRGAKMWRSNGMVLVAFGAFLAFAVILVSLTNFGLLARQRTQLMPFLFMLPTMAPALRRMRWRDRRSEPAARG